MLLDQVYLPKHNFLQDRTGDIIKAATQGKTQAEIKTSQDGSVTRSDVPAWLVQQMRSRGHRITESQNSRGWKGPLWVI